MKKLLQNLILTCCLFPVQQAISQINFTNYSDKNHVYAINITHDTVWIGTDGGIVVRDFLNTWDFPLSVNDSLSSNFITAIAVDSVGNKWFATADNGLIRYNNGKITYFSLVSPPNLPLKIHCLEVDGTGNLWIGLDNGVARYNVATQFQFYNTASSIEGMVKSICIDGSVIWFGTDNNGLYRFDGGWSRIPASSGLSTNKIIDIAANQDTVFVATDVALFYHLKSGSLFTIKSGMNMFCLNVEINPINGTTWVGTQSNIFRLSEFTNTPFTQFSMSYYPILEFDRTGTLWAGFGEQGSGVKTYNGSIPYTYQYYENAPPTNRVNCSLTHNGNVYFGTQKNGIVQFDGATFSDFYTIEPEINALASKADTIYAGTANGYTIFRNNTNYPYTTTPVKAINVDKNGVVWFGTNNGIFKLENNIQSAIMTTGLLDNNVKAIAVDSVNNVWFMHPNGLTMYNGSSYQLYQLTDLNLVAGTILNDIAVDTLGNIWIASSDGVIYKNGNSFNHITASIGGLPDTKVLTVCIDKFNIKYFGMASYGISIFNNNNWKNINRNSNKLASLNVTSIKWQPQENKLWASGEYGGITSLQIFPIYVEIQNTTGGAQPCAGQLIHLGKYIYGGIAFENIQCNWTSNNGSLNETAQEIDVRPTLPITYYLVVNDGFMFSLDTIFIDPFQFKSSAVLGPQYLCSNSNIGYYNVPDDAFRTYTWTVQGGIMNSGQGTSAIEVIWDVSTANSSLSLFEREINLNCTVSQQLPITIEKIPNPQIVRKGENLIICRDSGMMNYQWYMNEAMLAVPNRQFIDIKPFVAAGSNHFNVVITSKAGCSNYSDFLYITNNKSRIYPNPAKSILNIEFYNENENKVNVEIRDMQGKLKTTGYFSANNGGQKLTIDLEKYKPGVYNYQIKDGSKIYSIGNFIVD